MTAVMQQVWMSQHLTVYLKNFNYVSLYTGITSSLASLTCSQPPIRPLLSLPLPLFWVEDDLWIHRQGTAQSTYVCRVQSSVPLASSKILTPRPIPLSTQRVCPPPAPKAGVHTRRAVRGWGVNIFEDARHWGLFLFNPSTGYADKLRNRICWFGGGGGYVSCGLSNNGLIVPYLRTICLRMQCPAQTAEYFR